MIDLSALIDEYLKNWEYTHQIRIEGYKWRAFSRFNEEFDISRDGQEFFEMLKRATDKAGNLLNDGRFMARDTLLQNAAVSPQRVKDLFVKLYDEDDSLESRISDFKKSFSKLNKENIATYGIKTSAAQCHQSTRAISVYLSFRYPDRYFLYFKKMYQTFAEKVAYSYIDKTSDIENLLDYFFMCREVKVQLESHKEIINHYHILLQHDELFDLPNHHLLTQDFIYNIAFHLAKGFTPPVSFYSKIENIESEKLICKKKKPKLQGNGIIDYAQESVRNKRLGDAGELFVLEYEKQKLVEAGHPDLAEQVEHTAAKNDGVGYDIKSFDENENPIYIEVKTTKGNCETTFYISESERLFSEKNSNFYLYRLYNFDETLRTGNILIIKGDVSNLCSPVSYRVDLMASNSNE